METMRSISGVLPTDTVACTGSEPTTSCGSSSRQRRLPAEGVLVVVHPDLEHLALDADLVAELLHGGLVVLLDAPPQPLRERQHPVLLLRSELGAEPLLTRPGPGRPAAAQGHADHRRHHHGADQPGHVVAALVVGGGRQRQRPLLRHLPRAGEMLVVVEVPGRCAVVGGELVVVGGDGGQRGGGFGAARSGRAGLLPVEVAVAATGRAAERVDGALLAGGHELAAAVHRVAADAERVVLEALTVPRRAATSAPSSWWRPEAPGTARICWLRAPAAACPKRQARRLHRRVVARAHRHRRHFLVAVIVLVEVHGCR
jgi:hypothetical protein